MVVFRVAGRSSLAAGLELYANHRLEIDSPLVGEFEEQPSGDLTDWWCLAGLGVLWPPVNQTFGKEKAQWFKSNPNGACSKIACGRRCPSTRWFSLCAMLSGRVYRKKKPRHQESKTSLGNCLGEIFHFLDAKQVTSQLFQTALD